MSLSPGVLAVARRELQRMRARVLYPLLVVVLPLVSFALLWTIFSAGTIRNLPVAVVDLDSTPLSRQLARMLDATPTMTVTQHVGSGLAAEELMLRGEIYAAVLIPRDLERNVLRGAPASVILYRNSQLLVPSSLVRRDAMAAVGTLSAGIEIRQREARGETPAAARDRFEPIRTDRHALFNPWLNYVYFLVSSLLPTMLQIFVIIAAVHAVGIELKEGTGPEWLAIAGGSVTRAVVGKLMPYTAGFLLVAWFMIAFTIRFMGVPLHGDLGTLLVGTTLFILAYEGVGVVLAAWFANLRFATSAAAFIATPAFAFVGLTFPTMAMPPVAQAWGALLPLTHYLRLLVEQIMRGAPPAASLPELGALAAFVVVTPLIATRRLGTVLRDESYWGRL